MKRKHPKMTEVFQIVVAEPEQEWDDDIPGDASDMELDGNATHDEEEEIEEAHLGFKKLKNKLAHQKGVTNPGGLAASIGRKKYGNKKFNKMSHGK